MLVISTFALLANLRNNKEIKVYSISRNEKFKQYRRFVDSRRNASSKLRQVISGM